MLMYAPHIGHGMPRVNETRRRRVLQASGAGLAAMVAGCFGGGNGNGNGGGGGDGGGEVHVLTDYANKAWEKRWSQVIEPGFEEEFPEWDAKIEAIGASAKGEQRLATLLQSGNPPEIMFGSSAQWGDIVTGEYGSFIPDVVEYTSSQVGGYYDVVEPWLGPGDKFVQVPHGIYIVNDLMYRKDIYDELGLSVPKTWDELLSNTEAIDNSDFDIAGFSIAGTKTNKKSIRDFETLMYNAGPATMLRWKSDAKEEAEVHLPKEESLAALNMMQDLAEYSPDPSSQDWGTTIKYWNSERIAQTFMLNTWPVGSAYSAGNIDIIDKTRVTIGPKRTGDTETIIRGRASPDGAITLKSDGLEGGKEFLKYLYGDPDRHAANLLTEPFRFSAPAPGIRESDTWQNHDIFEASEGARKIEKQLHDEILPNLGDQSALPTTPAAFYVSKNIPLNNMVNRVLVQGKDPEESWKQARETTIELLKEGKERAK